MRDRFNVHEQRQREECFQLSNAIILSVILLVGGSWSGLKAALHLAEENSLGGLVIGSFASGFRGLRRFRSRGCGSHRWCL